MNIERRQCQYHSELLSHVILVPVGYMFRNMWIRQDLNSS